MELKGCRVDFLKKRQLIVLILAILYLFMIKIFSTPILEKTFLIVVSILIIAFYGLHKFFPIEWLLRVEYFFVQNNLNKIVLTSEEEAIANKLRETLNKEDKKVILILGESGSGKTHIALDILNDIRKNQNQFLKLQGRILYCCFNSNSNQQNEFLKVISNESELFLIIDDAHCISKINIPNLSKLINDSTKYEKIILFAQYSFRSNIRISDLDQAIEIQRVEYAQNLNIQDDKRTSHFHLFLSAYALHNSTFTLNEILSTFKDLEEHFWKRILFYLYIRRLIYSTKIRRIDEALQYYSFHALRARVIKNTISDIKDKELFDTFLSKLSINNFDKGIFLKAWLYHIEKFDDSLLNYRYFFTAMIKEPNFQFMLESINNANSDTNHYEKALLYEKTGKFERAREEIQNAIKKEPNNQQILIDQIEISHEDLNANISNLEILKNSTDIFIRLQAQYWDQHILMHRGSFENNVEVYLHILNELINHTNIAEQDPYHYYHLLRRTYFDAFRSYYLSAVHNEEILKTLYDHEAKSVIKTQHPEADAFINKFIFGHYLHYEILYKKEFIKNYHLSETEQQIFKIKDQDLVEYKDINNIITLAIAYYEKSIGDFKKFNDKTYNYINLRIYELYLYKIVANIIIDTQEKLQIVYKAIDYYENYKNEYAQRTGYQEFIAYSYVFLAKCYYILSYIMEDGAEPHQNAIDMLDISIDVYRKETNNEYGHFRSKILRSLITHDYTDTDLLKNDIEIAEQKNYRRESEILKKYSDNRPPVSIYKIFGFYPIVLQ